MNFKKLLSDDEGVSPVIGVILMVAITVILAAVIAAFVLGLGDSGDPAPQTSFDFDFDLDDHDDGSAALTITAQSGDTIDATQVSFGGEGSATEESWDEVANGGNGEISAGSSVTLETAWDGTSVDPEQLNQQGGTLNVVWESADGDDSSILASFDVQDFQDSVDT